MASKRGLALLAVVTGVVVIAAVMSKREHGPAPDQLTGPYLPELLGQANEIERVVIRTATGRVTLQRADGAWLINEKGGYPAATERVRELVLGLARLQRVEAKTSNPVLYEKLGLRDVTENGARSTLVQLLGADDASLATIVLGNRKTSPIDPGKVQLYVRIPGDAQTWLVEGALPAARETLDWIDRRLLDLTPNQIHSVEVRHPDGEVLRVVRATPDATDLMLADLEPDEEVESAFVVNDVVNSLARLNLDDVRRLEQPDLSAGVRSEVRVETFGGLRVEATVARLEDETVVSLNAAAGAPHAGTEGMEKTDVDAGKQDAAEHARRLNRRWDGWLFVIGDDQLGDVLVRRSDLLRSKQELSDHAAKADLEETR
jgi:hypothetical protein